MRAMVNKMKKSFNGGYFWAFGLGWPPSFLTLPGYSGVLLAYGLWWIYVVLGRRVEMLPMRGKAVLITGSDTGFGHALAKLLSDKGVTVFAGVLDENSPGAEELRRHGSVFPQGPEGPEGSLHVLQLDVTDCGQIEQAHRYICAQVGETGLWGMVNNAGILGYVADAEILPLSMYKNCLAVNFLGVVEICQVFLPLLRRSRGRIVNVCSMAGDVPIPGFAPYSASKAALIMLSKILRLELARWGVEVAIVQPAGFRTHIFGSSKDWKQYQEEILRTLSQDAREDYGEDYILSLQNHFSNMKDRSSEDIHPVLDDLCHALMSVSPRSVYTPGQCGWLIPFLHRLCPTKLYDIIIMRLFQFKSGYTPAGLKENTSSMN